MIVAKAFIWAFYLLIGDQALISLGSKFTVLPIKPTYAYAVIALGLLTSGAALHRGLRPLKSALSFFAPFAALVLLIAATYRGENPGPDFGYPVMLNAILYPTSLSYAIWPALNLITCAGLFLLALRDELRSTIILAAFTALCLQVGTMEVDMWFRGLFGDMNGRAGGLAQNANVAALLLVFLGSLCLRTRLAPFAVTLVVFGVVISQSRSGMIAAAPFVACYLFDAKHRYFSSKAAALAGALLAVLAVTITFSPILHPSAEVVAVYEARRETMPLINGHNRPAKLDGQLSLEERIEARSSVDESASLRVEAFKFFAGVLKDHPAGIGTGFTNKFVTGPHNTFLKVAVENSIAAPFLLFAMLSWITWRAASQFASRQISLAVAAWVTTMFYHTSMIDPIMLPALAVGLGLGGRPKR